MSRAGLTLLYAGHTYFEDLALPGWAPQPDWQLAFGAAAAELTDNHWIDDLKVRALALPHLLPMSTQFEFSLHCAVPPSRHTTHLGCATLIPPMGSTDHKSSA